MGAFDAVRKHGWRRLCALLALCSVAGCGFYGYGGSALTRANDISSEGDGTEGSDVSVNVYALDIGGVASFGPAFVESGLWSAWSRVTVRDSSEMSVQHDGNPDAAVYIGGGIAVGGKRTVAAVYGRIGFAAIPAGTDSGNVTQRLYELGLELCPAQSGRKFRVSWCGRIGLMIHSGTAIPFDNAGKYTGLGPAVWFGPRWEMPR